LLPKLCINCTADSSVAITFSHLKNPSLSRRV
jgi:hypothetical protein